MRIFPTPDTGLEAISRKGLDTLLVADMDAGELLRHVLGQLKIMNVQLSLLTDDKITEQDTR